MFAQLGGGVIGLRIRREVPAAHVLAIRGYRARDLDGEIRIRPHEFRPVARGKADEIVEDEYLAVAIGSGADADRGNAQLFGDARGQLPRHGFEHDGKSARSFHGARVLSLIHI